MTTGFIYYVTYSGVTGKSVSFDRKVLEKIKIIKSITQKDVYVGFGISTAADLKKIFGFADGGIIGSAIIENKITPAEILKAKK